MLYMIDQTRTPRSGKHCRSCVFGREADAFSIMAESRHSSSSSCRKEKRPLEPPFSRDECSYEYAYETSTPRRGSCEETCRELPQNMGCAMCCTASPLTQKMPCAGEVQYSRGHFTYRPPVKTIKQAATTTSRSRYMSDSPLFVVRTLPRSDAREIKQHRAWLTVDAKLDNVNISTIQQYTSN